MIDRADKANVALRANFTRIYEDIRFKAKRSIKGARVTEPLTIWIMPDGDFTVEEKRD
jgi:transcriptional regulator